MIQFPQSCEERGLTAYFINLRCHALSNTPETAHRTDLSPMVKHILILKMLKCGEKLQSMKYNVYIQKYNAYIQPL